MFQGARVLLACRDVTKAERAAEEIRKSTGNNNVAVYVLDLASLKSVRRCAGEVIRKEPKLDILINNAGKYSLLLDLVISFILYECPMVSVLQ